MTSPSYANGGLEMGKGLTKKGLRMIKENNERYLRKINRQLATGGDVKVVKESVYADNPGLRNSSDVTQGGTRGVPVVRKQGETEQQAIQRSADLTAQEIAKKNPGKNVSVTLTLQEKQKQVQEQKQTELAQQTQQTRVPEYKSGFEIRTDATLKRQRDYANSEGLQRIQNTANVLTFGRGTPSELRSPIGRISQNVVAGAIGWPLYLGGGLPMAGEKLAAVTEAVFNPEMQKNIPIEASRSWSAVESKEYSFLPGGTPINEAGYESLISAGLFALPGSGSASIKSSKPVNVESLKVPMPEGEATVWTGVTVQAGSRGTPVIGISEGKPVIGVPRVDFSKADLSKGYIVETAAQTKIIKENLNTIYTTEEAAKLGLFQTIARATQNVKSAFIQDKFTRETKTLNPQGVQAVIDFAKSEKGTVYGSFPSKAQMPESKARTPGDIDVQLKTSTEAVKPRISILVENLKQKGNDARLSQGSETLIETKGKDGEYYHAVDIHTKDTLAEDVLSPNFAFEKIYGFNINQKPISIENVKSQPLSEQGLRKGASMFTIRKEGFGTEAHRAKDVNDFFNVQDVLLESRKIKSSGGEAALQKLKGMYPGIEKTSKQPEATKVLIYEPPKSSKYPNSINAASRSKSTPNNSMSMSGSANSPLKESPTIVKESSSLTILRSASSSSYSSNIIPSPISPSPLKKSHSHSGSSPSPSPSPFMESPGSGSSGSSGSSSSSSSSSASSSMSRSDSFSSSPSPSPSPSPSNAFSNIKTPPSKSRYFKEAKGKPLYRTEIRRRGVFLRGRTVFESKETAVKSALYQVQNTAAASFRIVDLKTGEATDLGGGRIPFGQIKESSREKNVFIEQPKFRIKSPGEKSEITAKGIMASSFGRKSKKKGKASAFGLGIFGGK